MFDLTTLTDGQGEAVTRQDCPIFIMAGAGTGKTYTLSKRVAYQMSQAQKPLSPEKLIAITFTEAAAAELLDKARIQAIRSGAANSDKIEAAWISTIHSMCRRLLSENAIDAGIDPGLVVLTESQAETLMVQSIDEAIDEADSDKLARCVSLLKTYDKLIDIISDLISEAAHTPGGIRQIDFGFTSDGGLNRTRQELKSALEDGISIYEETIAKQKNAKTKKNLEADLENIQVLLSVLSIADEQTYSEDFSLASRCNDIKEIKTTISNAYKNFSIAYQMDKDLDLIDFIVDTTASAEKHFAKKIESLRSLTFDTLLSKAHELLTSDELSQDYSQRFDSIMVDEFQDTDAVQCSIIERLCNDERDIDKLIVVGDRQQSIYGFRGAEVVISDDMQSTMEKRDSDASVPLDVNFRSNPEILSFVSDIFSDDYFFGSTFLELEPADKNDTFVLENDTHPVVELIVSKTPSKGPQFKNSLRAEADAIAQRFKEMRDNCPNTTYDDMALILRSFTHVETYIEAFRALNIPCAITGGRRFYSFPEVQAFCNFLRVIKEPDNNLSVFRCLESELFALSDSDLASLKIAYNTAREADEEINLIDVCVGEDVPANVQAAGNIIKEARQALSYESLSAVLSRVFEATRYEENAAFDSLSATGKIANAHKIIDLICDLEETYGNDWRGVIDEILAVADKADSFDGSDNSQPPGRIIGTGDFGCVSIMTIHASKGLEYDVVAVSHVESVNHGSKRVCSIMEKTGNTRTMRTAIDLWGVAKDLKNEVVNANDYLSFLTRIYKTKAADEEEEKKRLAYVALTRAKKKLIWTAGLIAKKDGEFGAGEQIFQHAVEAATGINAADISTGIHSTKSGTNVSYTEIEVPDTLFVPEPQHIYKRTDVRPYVPRTYQRDCASNIKPKAISFTGDYADKYLDENVRLFLSNSASSTQLSNEQQFASKRTSQAAEFGTAFHIAAKIMALKGNKLSKEQILLIARNNMIENTETQDELKQLCDEFFDKYLSLKINDSTGTITPECPIGYALGDTHVDGQIDLLIDNGTHKEIIDYKTGLIGRSDECVVEHYGYQALVYAAAALMVPGTEEVEVTFLLVEDGLREIKLPKWNVSQLTDIMGILENR